MTTKKPVNKAKNTKKLSTHPSNFPKSPKNHTKKPAHHTFNLKSPIAPLIIAALVITTIAILVINRKPAADYIVETNAFFAPFEFYEGREIKGVDIEIINRVASHLNKTIDVKDVEFDVIIDNVSRGRIADAGAAGLTITPARAEKVDFSLPYYTSVQYVIYDKNTAPASRDGHILWDTLKGKTLGTQTGSTGYLFADAEITEGVLKDTNTTLKGFDSHQLAADAISARLIDYCIADELAAKYIVEKNPSLAALPLYYAGPTPAEDFPAEESYAIAVNKNRPELLAAFNAVLEEMLKIDPSTGTTEIDRLVLKYMGF